MQDDRLRDSGLVQALTDRSPISPIYCRRNCQLAKTEINGETRLAIARQRVDGPLPVCWG